MFRNLSIAFMLFPLSLATLAAQTEDKPATPKEGYLGIQVDAVPQVIYSQLHSVIPQGHGVHVVAVKKDSPADKAHIKVDDILLKYHRHQLHSSEQLLKLVRADKPGKEVSISYVREGKSNSCKVTLGEMEMTAAPEKPRVFRFTPDERLQIIFEEEDAKREASLWESFEAIRLTRQDNKQWQAEIEYRNKDGKKVSKMFKGKRDEIHKAIDAETDLPIHEKQHLLRTLNLHVPIFEFHFPPFGFASGPVHHP